MAVGAGLALRSVCGGDKRRRAAWYHWHCKPCLARQRCDSVAPIVIAALTLQEPQGCAACRRRLRRRRHRM
jgi:hypothetical protein